VIYCDGGEAIKRAQTGSVHGVGKTSKSLSRVMPHPT
jgi:hypothetical protein